jgi:hypothetical protein
MLTCKPLIEGASATSSLVDGKSGASSRVTSAAEGHALALWTDSVSGMAASAGMVHDVASANARTGSFRERTKET